MSLMLLTIENSTAVITEDIFHIIIIILIILRWTYPIYS